MIIDITGIELLPGNNGKACPENGTYPLFECCYDEYDYMLCCSEGAFCVFLLGLAFGQWDSPTA